MSRVAKAVPGFLHISLFLFFTGLGDSLLNINSKVALTTIVPIGISGLLYTFTTFAPIIYPQSPYQNSFSGIFWYLFQKLHGRRFRDRGPDRKMKSVSTYMGQGQLQLAMEETDARKDRDVQAIRWLMNNLTEDAEMEKFFSAIPGSFNTDWGTEVWKRLGEDHESEDRGQDTTTHQRSSSWSIPSVLRPIIHLVRKPTPRHPPTHAMTRSSVPHPSNGHLHSITVYIRGKNVVQEVSTRVARSVENCKNRKLFSNDALWRKSTRSCIETILSLVHRANAKPTWFGDISELLGDIGRFEKIQELSLAGTDQLFVIHWTCLSLVAIRQIIEDNPFVREPAGWAVAGFAREGKNDAQAGARKIDETLQKARNCLVQLYHALQETEDLTEVAEILRGHESQISQLERINIKADRLEGVDQSIFKTQDTINDHSHQITFQIPGVLDDLDRAPIPFSLVLDLSLNTHKGQFIQPMRTLKAMCSPAMTLRNILEGQGDANVYSEFLKNLQKFRYYEVLDEIDEMQRQLWRLQDLRDGNGLGFTVDLFFFSLSQLLSTSSSKESHSALYAGTFQAITSDWSKYKDSIGTRNLLLSIATSRYWAFDNHYPANIVNEFLLLLGNIFEGQTGPHIDKARHQLESFVSVGHSGYKEKVLRILTRG